VIAALTAFIRYALRRGVLKATRYKIKAVKSKLEKAKLKKQSVKK
jgi:hypothetical protein